MEFLSTNRAAQLLQTSRDTIVRLINEGEIKAERVSPRGNYRIRYKDLAAYAEQHGLTLNVLQN